MPGDRRSWPSTTTADEDGSWCAVPGWRRRQRSASCSAVCASGRSRRASTAPGGDEEVGCCVARNDEVECERTTVGECAAESGTKVDSCDPNPCAPSSPGIVRCCLPDVQGGGGSGRGGSGSGGGSGETENEM